MPTGTRGPRGERTRERGSFESVGSDHGLLLRLLGWMPLSSVGTANLFCKRRAAQTHKAELNDAKLFQSLVDAARQKTPVDGEQVTSYETGGVGGEKNGCSRDFVRLPEAPHRCAH